MSGRLPYHGAVLDHKHDFLKHASERECNQKDDIGMSPTLLAAQIGDLKALQTLIYRGGKPDQENMYGQTALHLAAQKGHMAAVKYLIGYGANVFVLDGEMKSLLDVAYECNHEPIVKYIDAVINSRMQKQPELVEKFKRRAQEKAQQRARKAEKAEEAAIKAEERAEKERERRQRRNSTKTNGRASDDGPMIDSRIQLDQRRFSDYVHEDSKQKRNLFHTMTTAFKTSILGSGKRTASRPGQMGRRTSQVMYGTGARVNGAEEDPTRKPISTLFPGTGHDMYKSAEANDDPADFPASIFANRSMHSMAFKPINPFTTSMGDQEDLGMDELDTVKADDEDIDGDDEDAELSDDSDYEEYSGLDVFLAANRLEDHIGLIRDESIDLDALLLITEEDLVNEGVPLGPRRKILAAVNRRREATNGNEKLGDSWC